MRDWTKLLSAAALGAAILLQAPAQAANLQSEANVALQAGQADKALAMLRSLPPGEANSAQAHNLRCRVLFTLEQWNAAANECQQAVNMEPNNSDYHMWLGRALGESADKASFLSAYGLAKRAVAELQRATQLDPHNAEALADLGEFYNSAPGIVGGGEDKAESVAKELDRVDPARAHELRAGIAMSNHDYGTAEREFKESIALSKDPAFQWMRLASFYRKTKQWALMDNAVRAGFNAAERNKHSAVALFNGASVLIEANRDLDLARRMLEAYLASPVQTEEAPTFVAHVWLARLLAKSGDRSGAQQQRQAALALANSYKPAQNLKF
ncbi:MAG: tetratricopeptide repeat protein [Acidobacteriota bacterium]